MNTQVEIEILQTITDNHDTFIERNKNFTVEISNTLIELLGILHKATNTPQFEKMRSDLIQIRGENT